MSAEKNWFVACYHNREPKDVYDVPDDVRKYITVEELPDDVKVADGTTWREDSWLFVLYSEPKVDEHPPYIDVYHSIGGWKAKLMVWADDDDFPFYEPWNTGPGFEKIEDAKKWARSWAEAEEIKFRE